ncbi:SDR family NAD(P)-dependent oxidoreductase [Cryptosporangium japonicum]|uniref:SDR family oxidoreductase n=1 Tax=Cryptosporangium japonicum TaxID=80872 RepID=A0ABP3DEE4_9ACTN
MTFSGAGVVVTGAGSGIGRATAVHLASLGAEVVVADLDTGGGEETVETIRAEGGTATFVHADVADPDSVDELIERAVRHLGGLDLAVNNAGIGHAPSDLHELEIETWDQVLGVDLRGTFLCLRAELKVMVDAGHGSVVNMASNAGLKNAPGMAAYTAAKHGVIGLTKNAALQYARRNIRINAICPGTVLTAGLAAFPEENQREWAELIPMGRIASTEEIAQAVAYLLSDQAAFITGIGLLIDGGLMYD